MASNGFIFPPPPPPPPRQSAPQPGPPQYSSQQSRGGRGNYSRGRGFSDRPPRGDSNGTTGGFPGPNTHSSHQGASGQQRGSRGGNNSFNNQAFRGQKRRHEQAFQQRPDRYENQYSAPPPVPSFGFQMPLPPPPPDLVIAKPDAAKAKQKSKNVLGLTPSFDDSSQGDVDEEARYAAVATASADAGAALQFTYRGQMSSLSTAEEIAAWIAERRKKFPTKEKAAAAKERAKIEADERAKRRAEATQERRDRGEHADRGRGRGNERGRGRGRGKGRAVVPSDRPKEAESEAQKLQKELAEAKKRIAELEKRATTTSGKQIASSGRLGDEDEEIKKLMESSSENETDGAMQDSDDEGTSSSGQDSNGTDGDDNEDNDVPLEMSSKRSGPDKVILPPRKPVGEQQICRDFARSGRCPRGRGCHFKHEPGDGSSKRRGDNIPRHGTVQGKSLYQRLKEQQEEISDEFVLQHIMYLGDKGYLAEPDNA